MDYDACWREPTNYIYIDFETYIDNDVRLNNMTLREYLAAAEKNLPLTNGITDLSLSVNFTEPKHFATIPTSLVAELTEAAQSPDWMFVAHNAAFDMRVLHFLLGVPYPKRWLCSLELACAAWPNQPGGYSLDNLGKALALPQKKLDIDLTKCSPAERAEYCNQDVRVGCEIARRAIDRLPPRELALAELTNNCRKLELYVDQDAITNAVDTFVSDINAQAAIALEVLGEDADTQEVFGKDGANIKSVKPHVLKDLLLDRLGFDTETISKKKLNPEKVRQNEEAAQVLEASSMTNKTLWHKRNLGKYLGRHVIDVELGYYRAHTGRLSSPQPGNAKGLNFHNQPKRNPIYAKPVRSSFAFPDHLCATRGDLSNVEYRVEGWLTHCQYIEDLFAADVFADPYAGFWLAATGQKVTKKDPARQVAKAAVLGLGYLMGIGRWITEMLIALADPSFRVTLADLQAVCADQKWGPVSDRYAKTHGTKLNAPWEVVAVAYHTREAFHDLHPEFSRTARWLLRAVEELSRSIDPDRTLLALSKLPTAPDCDRFKLLVDDTLDVGRSVRVECGNWTPTIAWRDLGLRNTKYGFGLTSILAGNKGYRSLSKNILIENIAQSAARNALMNGQLQLWDRGYDYQLSVHDEEMLIVDRDGPTVLQARKDLLDVFGPGNQLGYDWAVLIDPSEVCVTRTLWEAEEPERWAKLENGDADALDNLV